MAKEIQGECNRCGHCGCNAAAGGDPRFYPGIAGSQMSWGKMNPGRDMDICALIRTAFTAKFGGTWDEDYGFEVDISIVGGGPPVDVTCYVTRDGIQKSAVDASCPFWQAGTPNECLIWEREQWPAACRNTPYFTDEADIAAWELNHPHVDDDDTTCGFWWADV